MLDINLDKKYAVPVFEKYTEEQIAKELKEAGLDRNW